MQHVAGESNEWIEPKNRLVCMCAQVQLVDVFEIAFGSVFGWRTTKDELFQLLFFKCSCCVCVTYVEQPWCVFRGLAWRFTPGVFAVWLATASTTARTESWSRWQTQSTHHNPATRLSQHHFNEKKWLCDLELICFSVLLKAVGHFKIISFYCNRCRSCG